MGPFLSVESTTQCYRDCSRGPSGPKKVISSGAHYLKSSKKFLTLLCQI